MIQDRYLSLVVPCKDESRALQAVLSNLPQEIDEVIIVDNNSKDQTSKTAKHFGAKVFFEPRSINGIGYGFALQKGIRESKGDIVICMDGDGSYPVDKIKSITNYLIKNDLDFISCNRLPFKNPKKMSKIRITGVRGLNFIAFLLFGYKLKDSLSGMWVFKRSVFDKLSFSEGNWNFSLEIKIKAISHPSTKFSEYPIPYHDRVFDKSKQNLFKTGLMHVFYLLSLKINLIRYGKNPNKFLFEFGQKKKFAIDNPQK